MNIFCSLHFNSGTITISLEACSHIVVLNHYQTLIPPKLELSKSADSQNSSRPAEALVLRPSSLCFHIPNDSEIVS